MNRTVATICLLGAASLLLFELAAAQDVPALFEKPLSPRIANYNIDVRLDAAGKKLEGNERLLWVNKSKDSIRELQFHLYLNGFRNTRSTFMQEAGSRSWPDKPQGWGYSEVRSLKVSYGPDLTPARQFFSPGTELPPSARVYDLTSGMHFIHPDDDNAEDKSVLAVSLPQPLRPGASIVVCFEFEAKLPEPPVARTGAKKEFFFVGQWFPKIGVYAGGWNTHQFHANSEFFADFGVYNVRMTVPETHVLGATGLLVSRNENGDGTATHFYHAEDVHDFAWASSPEFVEVNGKAQDVDIRVLLQPDHAGQGERHLRAAKLAVETFQNRFGDYPFPNLTLVDPRRGAGQAGGMEYPTLIATASKYGLPEGAKWLEDVIIHEFGHNYWYHLLASNEFEESWMDEGINTYTDILISELARQPLIDVFGFRIDYQVYNRMSAISGGDRDPIIRRAWDYYSRRSYGTNSYSKPGLVLTTLRKVLGDSTMNRIMRTYVARWRFKHPKSQDFFDIVNEVSGRDMSSFIRQAFYTNGAFDYTVASVFTRKLKAPEGFDFTVNEATADSAASDAAAAGDSASALADTGRAAAIPAAEEDSLAADSARGAARPMFESGVNVRRLEAFRFPVEIEVVFEDGEVLRESWDGQDLWKKFRYVRPAKLVSATVDPDRKIWIDRNFTNNSRTVKTQSLGVNKFSARVLFWLQFALEQPEALFFGTLLRNYLP